MSSIHRTPGGRVLRVVSPGAPSPALDAALAVTAQTLSAVFERGDGSRIAEPRRVVILLGRAMRTRDRRDVVALAAVVGALATETTLRALALAGEPGDGWSDRADDASRLSRAAQVLLTSLPRR